MSEADVDLGPLFDLLTRVDEGSIGLETARASARQLGAAGVVTPSLLISGSHVAVDEALQGQWRRSLRISELCFEAASAAHEEFPDNPALTETFLGVGVDLIEVLHGGLLEHGDIRLYLRALDVHRRTLVPDGFPLLRGLSYHRFGCLVLDAYTAGRSSGKGYQIGFDNWVDRALQSNDPKLITLLSTKLGSDGDPSEAPTSWPAPLEGLDLAERCLRAAIPLVIAARRGVTAKALMQTLLWQGLLGGSNDRDEIRDLARQSLTELPEDDFYNRISVLVMLQQIGDPVDIGDHLAVLEADLDPLIAGETEPYVWEALGQAASFVQQTDPKRSLALLVRRRELPQAWADEQLRSSHYLTELRAFTAAYTSGAVEMAWNGDIDEAATRALQAARTATTPEKARTAAADLITVMLATTTHDREGTGLELVEPLFSLDRLLWSVHEEPVRALVVGLVRGEGVNRMRAGDVDAAGRYYRSAADGCRDLRLGVPMVQCLTYLRDVVAAGTTELNELTAWLAAHSLDMELAAQAGAPPVLLGLANQVLVAQANAGTSAEVVQLLLQVLKGRRFTATLAEGTADFQLDDHARRLLAREAEAEAALPPGTDPLRPRLDPDAGLREDDLLTAWVDDYEEGPSDTPLAQVQNLRRAVERRLVASQIPESWPQPVALDAIKEALDARTALLILYEGGWSGEEIATWQFLVTKGFEAIAAGRELMVPGTIHASWEGHEVTMPPSGFYVGSLREAVRRDPGPLEISRQGAEELRSADQRYLQVVHNCRDKLAAAGIDRLVIAPHGAGRFAPLHLLGPQGKPAAGEWTITYLSNVAQLTVTRPPASRRDGVGVFGLSYADQPGLPTLVDSATEVSAIADAYGTTAHLDADATEPAFIQALTTCRYVHLRAHGRMFVEAPSFHTVFLHPSPGYDGRLRAYEVLPLDLHGLEVVTLGACETALGRVDRMDNPRGLPAALLLAGAQAVIGTLWEVLAEASTCFFTDLYRHLANDDDVVSAFAAAQRTTRKAFPQYRDWGAFYLVGGLAREATS